MDYSTSAKVTIEDLKLVLSSLKSQKETINSIYNGKIKSVLESSNSCLSVSGLDYSSIINTFDSTFNELDYNFETLISVLEKNVIGTYTELAGTLKNMFGTEFASKMTDILGIKRQ